MSIAKGRVFYALVGLAALAAGIAPWALGLGHPASAAGAPDVPALAPATSELAPAASSELATASPGDWASSGHAAMLERVGAMGGGDSGKAAPAQPALYLSCGATRDNGSFWTVIPSGNEPCPGVTAYSYTPNTSPKNVRTAIWWPEWVGGFTAPKGYYTVKAWIPSKYAGALVEYDARYCGQGSWQPIGTINQENSTGWTAVSGKLYVDPSEAVCQIREENTGPGVFDMTEDALEILAN